MDFFTLFIDVPKRIEELLLLETFNAQWLIEDVPDHSNRFIEIMYAEALKVLLRGA